MSRRSKDVTGFVNFPVDDPDYKNSKEGGIFVRLVVEEKEDTRWMECCGGYQTVIFDEVLIGDDVHPDPPPFPDTQDLSFMSREDIEKALAESNQVPACLHHFPVMEGTDTIERFSLEACSSVPYLAALTIGSTGWSGWNSKKQEYWKCTYEDLSDEGKALYDILKKLYGKKCNIYLQTWLDT